MALEILIVDDESDIRTLLRDILEDEGYVVREASHAAEARQRLQERPPALVILDIWMRQSDMDGLELQKWIRRVYPSVPALMISGHGNIETAVQAMKEGAFDFIEKPFKADRLTMLVERALADADLRRENAELRSQTAVVREILGNSPAMIQLRQVIDKVAPTQSRVMITGPSGVGKELAARTIHRLSDRQRGRFVLANCAMLSPERVNEELFGTEGGATESRIVGLFEQAHGGSLYLDEICDLPLETQGKIVRAVQDQRFRRVGGNAQVEVDVRVISASTRSLDEEIASGNLREDLFYRLSVVPVAIPPLLERREDIPTLADYFLDLASQANGQPRLRFSEDALAVMQTYSWPGNVRQMRNMIDWLLIMANTSDGVIAAADLPPELHSVDRNPSASGMDGVVGLPLKQAREHFEKAYLLSQVTRFDWNISRTASFVGMERSALHRKLKSLGITAEAVAAKTEGEGG